jgi:hypothetical protein
VAVLDILYHIRSFAKVLESSEPLDIIGTDLERAAFVDLKNIFLQLERTGSTDNINLGPFLNKLFTWYGKPYMTYGADVTEDDVANKRNREKDDTSPLPPAHYDAYAIEEGVDVIGLWDIMIKLIMVVIPPLREVFLGHVANSQDVPGWLNIMSRCFRANFTAKQSDLDVVLGQCYSNVKDNFSAIVNSATITSQMNNAMVLSRAPEIFVVSVSSVHLFSWEGEGLGKDGTVAGGASSDKTDGPLKITFPTSLDLNAYAGPRNAPANSSLQLLNDVSRMESLGMAASASASGSVDVSASLPAFEDRVYDLTSVIALESSGSKPTFDQLKCYFRVTSPGDDEHVAGAASETWYRSCGPSKDGASTVEEVPSNIAIENNFFNAKTNPNVHPRLLVYTRKDLPALLRRTAPLVSRAGQMRALGDVAFALAMTSENYDEARRCYEEAILLDESLKDELQENLRSLKKFESTQRAKKQEDQADLALANRRFKEASEQYKNSKRSAMVGSGIYMRVREKDERVGRLLTLDAATTLVERGEHYLHNGSLQQARDLYAQAHKLTPDFMHLHSIIVAIDRTLQMQASADKEVEAGNAMKAHKFRLANTLYLEVIALAPEKKDTLQPILDSLVSLMQSEDAVNRQRVGLYALEEKRYEEAISNLTEAMALLPPNSAAIHAMCLADRALVHLETKDYESATKDCLAAIEVKNDLALAHFRLGTANFGLELFDDALAAYDKANKCDSSLGEQIKAKLRQVTSAREVQQRKLREEERAKAKLEQDRLLKEKREADEQTRRKKAEDEAKAKAERARLKEEERQSKAKLDSEAKKTDVSDKEEELAKKEAAKKEAAAQKARDREAAKAAKELAKEKDRIDKEKRAEEEQAAKRAEVLRKKAIEEEQERVFARQREEKAAKEAEREKARIEREQLIAEREKARQEKLLMASNSQSLDSNAKSKAASTAPTAAAKPPVNPKPSGKDVGKTPASTESLSYLKAAASTEIPPRPPVASPGNPTSGVVPSTPPTVNSWASRIPTAGSIFTSRAAQAEVDPIIQEEFPPLSVKEPTRSTSRERDAVSPANQSLPITFSSGQSAAGGGSDKYWLTNDVDGMISGSSVTSNSGGRSRASSAGNLVTGLGGVGLGFDSNANVDRSSIPLLSRGLAGDSMYAHSELKASSASFVYQGTATPSMTSGAPLPQQSTSSKPSIIQDILEGSSLTSSTMANNLLSESSTTHHTDALFSSFGSDLGLGFTSHGFLDDFGGLDGLPSSNTKLLGSRFNAIGGLGDSLHLDSSDDAPDPILRALGGLSLDSPTSSMDLPLSDFRGLAQGNGLGGLGDSGHSTRNTTSFLGSGSLGMSSLDVSLPSLLSDPSGHSSFQIPSYSAPLPLNNLSRMSLPQLAPTAQGHMHHHHLQQQLQQQQHIRQQSGPGIDADIVRPEVCLSMFPTISWLGSYGIHMYYWSGDNSEWTEFALHLPHDTARFISGQNGSTISEVQRMSRCRVWIDREVLHGKEETFVVFHRGASGLESNQCMNTALALVSDILRTNFAR